MCACVRVCVHMYTHTCMNIHKYVHMCMPLNDSIPNAVAPVTEVYLLVLSKVQDTYGSTVGSFTV